MYFDGATMMSYRYPSKNSEAVFCRREPVPDGCEDGHGFDLDRVNIPIDALEVKNTSAALGENIGRGVFATMDIPRLAYVGLEKLVQTVYIEPSAYALIRSWDHHDYRYGAEILARYATAYGHSFSRQVSLRASYFCHFAWSCSSTLLFLLNRVALTFTPSPHSILLLSKVVMMQAIILDIIFL